MEIETLRFGRIEVHDDKVITFPKGLLGFAASRRFILFPHKEGSPFFWLQSIDDGNLAFVVMNPLLVTQDYRIDLAEEVLAELGADEGELEVMCIVTIPQEHPENMTVNLLGPLIIAAHNRLAAQIVVNTGDYSHRHPVVSPRPAQP